MIPRAPLRIVVVALLCSVAAGARADIRVWSEETTEGEAGVEADEEPLHLDVTGFIQPAYVWRQDDEEIAGLTGLTGLARTADGFLIRRARLGVRALVYPWLTLRVELDATQPTGLRDAWADARLAEGIHLRVGLVELPFLRFWQFRDSLHGFVEGPLYASSPPDRALFHQWDERAVGIMFHGVVGDVEAGPALEYGAGAFSGPGFFRARDSALTLAARLEGHLFGVPEDPEAENDVARSFTPKLSLGVGGQTGCDELARWVRGFTVDAELRWRGLYASTAFVWSKSGTREGDFLAGPLNYGADDACGVGASVLGAPVIPTRIAWGTHVQAQYALPELLFPVDGQALEVLARWELVRPSAPSEGFLGGDEDSPGYDPPSSFDGPLDAPDQWRLSLGLSWYPTAESPLRLTATYQLRRETEDVLPDGPDGPVLDGIDNDVVWVELTASL